MKKLLLFLLGLGLSFGAQAQNIRWDFQASTTNTTVGNLLPLYAIPFATVHFYSCNSSGTVCTTLANVYPSASSVSACSTATQVVYNGSSTCVATADYQGNFGGWFVPGLYKYQITYPGGTYSYYFSPGNYGMAGTGTVTNFSSGDFSPLFTVGVANPTTAPTQSFTAINQNDSTFFGNFSGSSAAPTFWTLLPGTNSTITPNAGAHTLTLGTTPPAPSTVLSSGVTAPVTGQNVIIYPTAYTSQTGDPNTGSLAPGVRSAVIGNGTGGGPLTSNTWGITWNGFALPSDIPAANVTGIYGFMISTVAGNNSVDYGSCSGTGGDAGLSPGGDVTTGRNWTLQQFTQLTGVTGANIGTISCNARTERTTSTTFLEQYSVPSVGLIVYYTGTPSASTSTAAQVSTPLAYNPASNSLFIDPQSSFHGIDLIGTTIAGLPTQPLTSSLAMLINNGSSSSDCTAGGGTNYVMCRWNGSNWSSFLNGSPSFSALTSGTNTTAAMLVGSGGSLGVTGTGSIQATNIAGTLSQSTGITITGSGTTASPYSIAATGVSSVATVASSETVTFSATPTFSNATNVSEITMTASITSFTMTAGSNGQLKILTFCQDATGGRTVSGVPANVRGFFTPGSTASLCSTQTYHYSTSQTAWLANDMGRINE